MDWGVSKGLSALYGATDKRENSKNELGILAMLDQKRKSDEQEDKLARQEKEAYEDKVNEFSATLLAPDRKKINDKAKLLSRKVRENVQLYGGDMSKFMANGGGQIMRDYKTSLLNSDEAVNYADNKKNMDMIVKAQLSGQGGNINQTDLANLNRYNKTGEGPITYTGLLVDIDMPDPKAYDFGKNIPAKDILMNESNYAKIYANYVTTFPNNPLPNKTELIKYTQLNHSGIGQNWQREASLQKAANARAKSGKGSNSDLHKYGYKTTGQIAGVFNDFGKTMLVKDFKEGYWKDGNNSKSIDPLSSEAYSKVSRDYALEEKGMFDIGRKHMSNMANPIAKGLFGNAIEDWIAEEYSVRNARMLYQGREMQFASAALGIQDEEKLNFASKEITGWMPDDDSYTAAGIRVGDLGDELDKEAYKGTWKVDAVISGAHGITQNSGEGDERRVMVMNVVDGGKVDDIKTEKWNKDIIGENGTIQMDSFIVMKNENGDTFYRQVDMSSAGQVSYISEQMGVADDYSGAVVNSEFRKQFENNANAITSAQTAPINTFYDQALTNKETQTHIQAELLNFSPDGNINTKRENLMTSFYAALSFYGDAKGEETYVEETKAGKFTYMIQEAANLVGKDYMDMLRDPEMNDLDFLSIMAKDDEPEQTAFYEYWLANYNVLSKR